MIETITGAAKLKVLIAVFSLLVLGGIYSNTMSPGTFAAAEANDPYTLDIQARSDLVNNAVSGVIDAQGKQEAWKYKQTCENANSFIQGQYLDMNQVTTLSPEQRQVNADFKAYLHEASFVVATCYSGETPDIAALHEAKSKLY